MAGCKGCVWVGDTYTCSGCKDEEYYRTKENTHPDRIGNYDTVVEFRKAKALGCKIAEILNG
jgi:hypothetical protein